MAGTSRNTTDTNDIDNFKPSGCHNSSRRIVLDAGGSVTVYEGGMCGTREGAGVYTCDACFRNPKPKQ